VPSVVLGDALIRSVRIDQAEDGRARQVEGTDRRLKLTHDRPCRLAVVARVELLLQLVEERVAVALGPVAEDVDEPAVAVDAPEVGTDRAREEQRGDGEVLPSRTPGDG